MTFGAMAAWQAWLLLAAAGAIAAGVFLIKLRPPRTIVPSLLLWQRVLDVSRELTLWERIRRAVSLAATVLIAVALALAVTRPGRSGGGAEVTRGRLLIVLDSSVSMQARTPTGETRWERAVAEARRLATGASGGETALATTADGLVEGPTTDLTLIETALDRLEPGSSDRGAWPRLAGATAVHFITDGAAPRALDNATIVHSVFEPAPNVAITAFEVRPSLSSESAGDAYLELANYAPAAQKLRLRLTRGSASIFDSEFDVGPSEMLRQVVPIARGGDPALRARVDARDNALDADDAAVVWVDRAQPLGITVVGSNTAWLKEALSRDPDVRATFIEPSAWSDEKARTTAEDALIYDRWAPPAPPARPALLFAPPPSTPWLLAGGATEAAARTLRPSDDEVKPRWEVPGDHRVVEGVDPFTLTIDRARTYSAPSLVPVARSTRGTPLVSVSESPQSRLVLVAFGAGESNLASAPAFPVLIGNALEWLTRPYSRPGSGHAAGGSHRPGLMSFETSVARVGGPDGGEVPLARIGDSATAMLRAPGLYTIEGGGARSRVAVNVGDPQLSNLMRGPASTRALTVTAGGSGRPWWVYCVLAAFVLVFAEWWTWQRRITV